MKTNISPDKMQLLSKWQRSS